MPGSDCASGVRLHGARAPSPLQVRLYAVVRGFIIGWLLASLGFRMYIHFFDTYSVTYGSLGAVIILLMWFYITGLMLLLGAEINSQIEAAAAERTERPVSRWRKAHLCSGGAAKRAGQA